jgi:hypothetical protein
MTSVLVLNSNSVIGSNNSQFRYNFKGGNFTINVGSQMCVSLASIPYSWYNINSGLYNNNSFQYTFSGSTFTFTLANGFYSVSDINNALQNYMISQSQYLIDNTGNYVFYIVLATNTTYYSNQFLLYSIPTSLPAGYTNSGGFVFSSDGRTPQIIITSNNFGSIIGFSAGTYPSTITTSNTNYLSNSVPNATPVNSLIFRCNLVSNNASMPTDILDTMPISSSFGSNISYAPQMEKWVDIKEGTYNNFTLVIQDQNFNTIQSNDPNILISLMIKQGPDTTTKPLPFINQIHSLKFD